MLIKAKKLSENLPNNNKIDLINDILSKDFPAGDLTIQFKAFTALPIPRMMSDFSRLHSAQPNADGRDILKHYAKSRMSDQDIEKLNIAENRTNVFSKLYPIKVEKIYQGKIVGKDKIIFARAAIFYKYYGTLSYLKLFHHIILLLNIKAIVFGDIFLKYKIGLKGIEKYKSML